MVRVLDGYDVTFVGVRVSDAQGARREIQRGDRHAGWNRGGARAAHADAICDLEVDTTTTTLRSVLARALIDRMRAAAPATAFARLRQRLATLRPPRPHGRPECGRPPSTRSFALR